MQVLPLASILDNILGRKYLTQFLETVASQGLVGYYIAVEELKVAQRKNWHQIGAEIFYTFIRNSTEIKVDKSTKKRMEAFLLGDKGPEVFYEIQQSVVKILEDKYYQPFVHSDFYKEMLNAMENEDVTEVDNCGHMEERQYSGDSSGGTDNGLHVGDHSSYARKKLDQLQEKLNNKSQVGRIKISKKRTTGVLNLIIIGIASFEIIFETGIESVEHFGQGSCLVARREKAVGGSLGQDRNLG